VTRAAPGPHAFRGALTMQKTVLSRRSLLKAGAAGLAATALPGGLARAQGSLVIGAVYVGPRADFGWNQAHAVAMDIIKGVPGVTVIEE